MNFKRFEYFNLIPIIIFTILFYKLLDNVSIFTHGLRDLMSLISYFFWGFAIAYILNPLMLKIELTFKTKRVMSIFITYLLFFSFITLLLILIIPSMIKSVSDLINKLPSFVLNAEHYVNSNIMTNKLFIKYGVNTYITNNINDIITQATSILQLSISSIFSKMVNISSSLFNIFTGIIISIYLLKDKEPMLSYTKKIFSSFLPKEKSMKFFSFMSSINLVFKQYVIGKSIDSLIIGLLCFIGLSLMSVKYSLLISLVIGITNLIPYFGNIIGLVPTSILTIFSSTTDTIKLIILVITLSLFDGWYLSPRIIGQKVGLNPIFIIIAITIGGAIYGALGMFLAIPLAAVIKTLIQNFIDEKYETKRS